MKLTAPRFLQAGVMFCTMCIVTMNDQHWPQSQVISTPGHYPHIHCQITNAVFRWQNRTFFYKSQQDLHIPCNGVKDIWDIHHSQDLHSDCRHTYDFGYAFTIYAPYGGNYFHLHYDMMIPLYAEIYHSPDPHLKNASKIFMPTIESHRLQKLSWDTPLFQDEAKYWNQLTRAVVGQHKYQPLDESLLDQESDICFKALHFGTRSVNFGDSNLITGFSSHIKDLLGVTASSAPLSKKPKIGIISRSRRRLILNEEEVVSALNSMADVELVKFEGMTFKQQVELVQQYSVLAGINGAGLMNCVYLPSTSTCLQMVPYEAQLNWRDYGKLLRARGPYIEWHNTHANLTRTLPSDKYNNNADTIVHIGDFSKVVKEALSMAAHNSPRHRQEL